MTLAEKFVSGWRKSSRATAMKLDRHFDHDIVDDEFHFYYFRDGSSAGTQGRGANFQKWVAGGVVPQTHFPNDGEYGPGHLEFIGG